MAKLKNNASLFGVFLDGAKIYCTNFLKFTHYMAFPVLGQLLGLVLIFGLASLYTAKLPELIEKYTIFNDFTTIVICVILITVPGMIIFLKAFWDYLVAYGALNSMAESAMNFGKVYDFPAHNSLVTKRTFSFIALWCVIGVMGLISIIPLFWIIAAVFFVYFILVFQIFIFEEDVSIIGCFKRSFTIIKGNFGRTFVLMLMVAFFTHYIFVEGVSVLFDFTKLTQIIGIPIEKWVATNIPLDLINAKLISLNPKSEILTTASIANTFVYQLVFMLVTGFTLPFRSICWTLWYKSLNSNSESSSKKSKVTKKLDKNILKRVEQED